MDWIAQVSGEGVGTGWGVAGGATVALGFAGWVIRWLLLIRIPEMDKREDALNKRSDDRVEKVLTHCAAETDKIVAAVRELADELRVRRQGDRGP